MWWWEFNHEEEPLQEDLVVYEKFLEFKSDRARMDKEKAERKGKRSQGTQYKIPDPVE